MKRRKYLDLLGNDRKSNCNFAVSLAIKLLEIIKICFFNSLAIFIDLANADISPKCSTLSDLLRAADDGRLFNPVWQASVLPNPVLRTISGIDYRPPILFNWKIYWSHDDLCGLFYLVRNSNFKDHLSALGSFKTFYIILGEDGFTMSCQGKGKSPNAPLWIFLFISRVRFQPHVGRQLIN